MQYKPKITNKNGRVLKALYRLAGIPGWTKLKEQAQTPVAVATTRLAGRKRLERSPHTLTAPSTSLAAARTCARYLNPKEKRSLSCTGFLWTKMHIKYTSGL